MTLIDKIAIGSGMRDKYRFEFENYEEFLRVLDSGRGCVLIGAHVGSWEVGGAFFGDYARRMHVVMYDAEYQKIKEILDSKTDSGGYKVIPINEGSIEGLVRMKRVIDDGEYLCFQGDRYLSKDTACEVKFMGRDARFPKGPFAIASKFGVPVVFYFALREKGCRYRFEFEIVSSEAGRVSQDELFGRYNIALEKIVRRYPCQWFNFYKFWS